MFLEGGTEGSGFFSREEGVDVWTGIGTGLGSGLLFRSGELCPEAALAAVFPSPWAELGARELLASASRVPHPLLQAPASSSGSFESMEPA